jgi:SNF2 family DNA or RNA helicase
MKVTKQLVKQIVERDEKVIVWTMFLDNVNMIKKHLSEFNPVAISGKMNIEERNRSVKAFKTNTDVKVLIATAAAKEGLTLTVANNAIFYDRSLSLDDYLQAQDRIHRISQTETCNIYNLKVQDSIDDWIDSLLTSKELAAKVVQGDITQDEYDKSIDYSFGEIIKNILGVE